MQGGPAEALNTLTVLVVENRFIGNVIGKKGANVHEVGCLTSPINTDVVDPFRLRG